MTTWDELRLVLSGLRDTGALTSYPDPRHDRIDQPPFRIGLASWATDIAIDLHHRFGDGVELRVGALGYPDPFAFTVPRTPTRPPLSPDEARVEIDGPGTVRSGTVLHTGLRLQYGRP